MQGYAEIHLVQVQLQVNDILRVSTRVAACAKFEYYSPCALALGVAAADAMAEASPPLCFRTGDPGVDRVFLCLERISSIDGMTAASNSCFVQTYVSTFYLSYSGVSFLLFSPFHIPMPPVKGDRGTGESFVGTSEHSEIVFARRGSMVAHGKQVK